MAGSTNNNTATRELPTVEQYGEEMQLDTTPQFEMDVDKKDPVSVNTAGHEDNEDDWETTDNNDDDNDDNININGNGNGIVNDDNDDDWETTDTETIAGDGLPGVLKVDPDKIPVDTNPQQAVRIGKTGTNDPTPKKAVRTNNIESPPINPAATPSSSTKTGIKLRFTGLKSPGKGKCEVILPQKRSASHLDTEAKGSTDSLLSAPPLSDELQAEVNAARSKGYTEDEVDVALILAGMKYEHAPPSMAPPSMAPPSMAPPSMAPPSMAPPSMAPPSMAPPSMAPLPMAPPCASMAPPRASTAPPRASSAPPSTASTCTAPPSKKIKLEPTLTEAVTTEAGPSRPRRAGAAYSKKPAPPAQDDSKTLAPTRTKSKTPAPTRNKSKTPAPTRNKSKTPAPAQDDSDDVIIVKVAPATRKQRTVDPAKPEDLVLINNATKAGSDIYDSDADDLPAPANKENSSDKPDLFRNIQWGPAADDLSNPADFPTEPEFSQFVKGRWERLPDGSIRDQKFKLLVKLTAKDGRKIIFKNPPPKNWDDQKAITMLNKRISQQIRRNTDVRFRDEVEPYLRPERVWISNNLVGGKPGNGWKAFVEAFNKKFEGKTIEGSDAPRPARTHSSLTKEIERFGETFYKHGQVPVTKECKGKGKAKAE